MLPYLVECTLRVKVLTCQNIGPSRIGPRWLRGVKFFFSILAVFSLESGFWCLNVKCLNVKCLNVKCRNVKNWHLIQFDLKMIENHFSFWVLGSLIRTAIHWSIENEKINRNKTRKRRRNEKKERNRKEDYFYIIFVHFYIIFLYIFIYIFIYILFTFIYIFYIYFSFKLYYIFIHKKTKLKNKKKGCRVVIRPGHPVIHFRTWAPRKWIQTVRAGDERE